MSGICVLNFKHLNYIIISGVLHDGFKCPKVNVDIEDIEFLRGLQFSHTNIAKMLGISCSILYQRLGEDGMSHYLKYSDISDHRETIEIKMDHPNDGERMIICHLATHGIIVPQVQVCASVHRIDPENTALEVSQGLRGQIVYGMSMEIISLYAGHSWWLLPNSGFLKIF